MTAPDRADGESLGRWALVGSGPAGRFLMERWLLRPDFPLVSLARMEPECHALVESLRLPVASDIVAVAEDPEVDGLILTLPLAERPAGIRAAISAGKRLLVEGSLSHNAEEAAEIARLAAESRRSLGVFHLRRSDPEFPVALAARNSGRLGAMQSVRWTECEYGQPPGVGQSRRRPVWQDLLVEVGPLLFDQLAQLTSADPLTVQAWPRPETIGFQARITYPGEVAAWIDVHRASLAGLRTGWVLEGTSGAFRRGRLRTLAADGELREEDVPGSIAPEEDVMAELRRLAVMSSDARTSLRRSVQASALIDAIRRAAELNQSVTLKTDRPRIAPVAAEESTGP